MLLLVTGSSCSGKSTAAHLGCAGLPALDVHDSDEHGVPSNPDIAWRQRNLQRWVEHAIGLQHNGTDLLLTGQSPIGELLAVPGAVELDLAVCLVDVQDDIRSARLEQRQPGAWSVEAKRAFNNWARWHRAHADDPAHQPEVIKDGSTPHLRWDRWQRWRADDPRWSVTTIDTSGRTVADTAAELQSWVQHSRTARDQLALALQHGWDAR